MSPFAVCEFDLTVTFIIVCHVTVAKLPLVRRWARAFPCPPARTIAHAN